MKLTDGEPTRNAREAVVMVPGLWLPGASLAVQARRLRRLGFDARTVNYPTLRGTLEHNAGVVDRFAQALRAERVHFVGHSLGGIVIRALFHYHPRQRPGRIVTVASPHGGSRVAEIVMRAAAGRLIGGRSVKDLLAGEPGRWALPEREIGVIRGDMPIGLGRFFPGLPRPNDGLLTLEETALAGASDEITLHVAHTAMLFSPEVARATATFLRHGCFSPATRPIPGPAVGPK